MLCVSQVETDQRGDVEYTRDPKLSTCRANEHADVCQGRLIAAVRSGYRMKRSRKCPSESCSLSSGCYKKSGDYNATVLLDPSLFARVS